MTTKDEALKQALAALENIHPGNMTPMAEKAWDTAITSLRATLAQQDEQKPVAWMFTSKYRGNEWFFTRYPSELTVYKADKVKPLYTAPPKRQPLTDDEVSELSRTMVKENKSVNWLCRAIEVHHGIGVEHDAP